MKHTLVRIPNCFTDMFQSAAELKLACAFYGLINAETDKDLIGNYIISVSQKTLAALCGCSEMTIRRTAAKLMKAGFILSQHRPVSARKAADGSLMLDKYVYTILALSCDSDYFRADKSLFCKVSGTSFKVYMLFCKLADSRSHSFFHSLTDICSDDELKQWRIGRTELCKAIKALCELRLIRRYRKLTYYGDFTENTYIIIIYIQGRIHKKRRNKKRRRVKEISPCAATQGAERNNNRFSTAVVSSMINHLMRFVKRFGEKTKNFFNYSGSG